LWRKIPPLFLAMTEAARSPALSPPFKKQGTTLNGRPSLLAISVPHIDGAGSSWWHGKEPAWVRCPCCEDYLCTIHQTHVHDCNCPPREEWESDPYKTRTLWPTPTARDYKGPCWNTPARDCLDHAVERGETKNKTYPKPPLDGGRLNPNWVEWLMGFPAGWTDLDASETQLCPKWLRSSGGRSSKRKPK
jgi:DNA (cytosine-5)-methyltransferase 1